LGDSEGRCGGGGLDELALDARDRPRTESRTITAFGAKPGGGDVMSGNSIGLSVVLPMKDQVRTIRRTLESVRAHLSSRPAGEWEILVVADGSDSHCCDEVIDFARSRSGIILLRNPGPIGCGYASRHGILLARGEKILLAGPELSAPISLLDSMELLLDQGHDLVVASRRTAHVRPLPPVRIRSEMVSCSVEFPVRLLAKSRALRFPTLFHLYRRNAAIEIFRRQKLDGASFAVEILYLARRYSYSVIEVPIPDMDLPLPAADEWSEPAAGMGELLRIRMNRLRGDYG
jgi:dolichyl-phosphate beta-glucosyltransferase